VLKQDKEARIGVVGLGTGSIAGLIMPGQHLTYFEIDPEVEPVSRKYFTYLNHSKGKVDIVLGDARQQIERMPAHSFDLIVLDAFSSDAIPVHLLTLEAIQLYFERLKAEGILVVHISNRYLDLRRVLRGTVEAMQLEAGWYDYSPSDDEKAEGSDASEAVVLTKSKAALQKMGKDWEPLGPSPKVLWTDDRSSLLGVFN
jgi:spermidine synthase